MEKDLPSGPPWGLTPILVFNDTASASDFYKKAFNAIEIARIPAPDGKRIMHMRLQIFNTVFVLMDEFPELSGEASGFRSPAKLSGTSVTLHLQVEDAFKVWHQVIGAGAISLVPMQEQFWGEYYGRLKDPFGHEWTVAQMLQHLSEEEVENSAKAVLPG